MDDWTDEDVASLNVATDEASGKHYLNNGLVMRKERGIWRIIGRWDPAAAVAAKADAQGQVT